MQNEDKILGRFLKAAESRRVFSNLSNLQKQCKKTILTTVGSFTIHIMYLQCSYSLHFKIVMQRISQPEISFVEQPNEKFT